ncbi:hypothetical protein BWZ22_10830 [Seonamhaeicola sp. S2-3]|uniref:2TM domain-containing protein n=1 Tax=Seonamhaeicola sp. S2-3 TaxID=1936081 RepID=UPI00097294A0|nr:2TM domain-containing protein [Seonamhaeicola sp. S2-3]APY11700.1 hypothetical protein BWZ22_10830 [Seonamhaeicola sp. S2-3]
MSSQKNKKDQYLKAKERVRNIKIFYYHLVGYIILVALLLYNIYILDVNNPYADFFTWFNSIIIGAWTIFIILHGRYALKGKTIFKKDWEDKKMKEFLENETDEETTIWE